MNALRSLLFILSIISYSSSSAATAAAVNSGDKVSFEIYYETLCPYCSNLIVNYLPELFDSDLISITDLKLIPYGNAKIKNGTIVCQVIFSSSFKIFPHFPTYWVFFFRHLIFVIALSDRCIEFPQVFSDLGFVKRLPFGVSQRRCLPLFVTSFTT